VAYPLQAANPTSTQWLQGDVKFNSQISSTNEIYSLLPNILQGIDSNQRIGQTINPISLKCSLALQLVQPSNKVWVPTENGSNPLIGNTYSYPEDIIVHVYFLTSKQVKSVANYSAVPITDLLAYNGSTPVQFSGSWWDAELPVNKELFNVIKHYRIRLYKGSSWQSYVANGEDFPSSASVPAQLPTDGYATGSNNIIKIDTQIPCPKKLNYREGATDAWANQPEDFFPFMVAGWCRNMYPLNSTVANAVYPVAISGRTYFKFTDS